MIHMIHKRRPVRLSGMGHRLFLLASLFISAGILLLGASPANAGETIIVPVHKVEVVKLDRIPSVVLIANPTIADVAVESERLIFLFGLEPGETNLLILDTEGEEILSAPVVVVPILERQVTVNRASANEEATYSCAPRCAAVKTPAGTGSDAQDTGSSAGGGAVSDDSGESAVSEAAAAGASDTTATTGGAASGGSGG